MAIGRRVYGLGTILTGAVGIWFRLMAGHPAHPLAHMSDLLILGGQVADAEAELLMPLQEEVWWRSQGLLGRRVALVEQQLADKSGIVGAAGLVMAPRV